MGVYVFNYTTWALRFPELSCSVPEPLAQEYFAEATLYVSNDACALIPYDPPNGIVTRAPILNLVTAHIAALYAPIGGKASSPIVGRISDASEGSVSVSAELDTPQSAAWFSQTKYGLSAYAAMAPFRTARYRASPGRFYQPPGPYGYRAGRGF